jgi:hypothetical protein
MMPALVLSKIAKRPSRPPLHGRVSRNHPHRSHEVICAIGQTFDAFGDEALTDGERIIWNMSLVLSSMIRDRPVNVSKKATVQHWSAVRRGFRAMGLPDAADWVVVLVKELAYRAALSPSDRQAEQASLLRLAALKQEFERIAIKDNIGGKFDALIDATYPWAD